MNYMKLQTFIASMFVLVGQTAPVLADQPSLSLSDSAVLNVNQFGQKKAGDKSIFSGLPLVFCFSSASLAFRDINPYEGFIKGLFQGSLNTILIVNPRYPEKSTAIIDQKEIASVVENNPGFCRLNNSLNVDWYDDDPRTIDGVRFDKNSGIPPFSPILWEEGQKSNFRIPEGVTPIPLDERTYRNLNAATAIRMFPGAKQSSAPEELRVMLADTLPFNFLKDFLIDLKPPQVFGSGAAVSSVGAAGAGASAGASGAGAAGASGAGAGGGGSAGGYVSSSAAASSGGAGTITAFQKVTYETQSYLEHGTTPE